MFASSSRLRSALLPLIALAFSCTEADVTFDSSQDPYADSFIDATKSSTHDALFRTVGTQTKVPPELLKAIAFVQTGLSEVETVEEFEEVEPTVGIMGIAKSRMVEGAQLLSMNDAQATATEGNVRAAAALLAKYAAAREGGITDLSQWSGPIAQLLGTAQTPADGLVVHAVFELLQTGVGDLSVEGAAQGRTWQMDTATASLRQGLERAPDYGGAVWLPSPNSSARTQPVKMVVIHTCEGPYASCVGTLRNPGGRGVSAHYVVREDGREIAQLVRENRTAFHIGATYVCGRNGNVECGLNGRGSNGFTIGIEHGGRAAQPNFPVGQIDASARLVCDITRDNRIPRDRFHIVGHGQLQPYNRTDPGRNWPWGDYLNRINGACGGGGGCQIGGDIGVKYRAVNGQALLGNCLAGELGTPDGVGRFNHFERGSIYWTPALGAHVVMGAIRAKYEANGWERGYVGYPTTDEQGTPDNVGRFNHFERGSIYYTPATGAHNVQGDIQKKWAALGWERSYLGYPTSDETKTPDGKGAFSHFQRGSIYWTPQLGAHNVQGAIHTRWAALGWERSYLGYPISDETKTSDGKGAFTHFQNGSIYWTPETGAHNVQGGIYEKWKALDWERSYLGYPTSDETKTPDGRGAFSHFQRGSIYWTPQLGAHNVQGAIHTKWASMDWERGLGYPITDELDTATAGGKISRFEKGAITWTNALGAQVLTPAFLAKWDELGKDTGTLGFPKGAAFTNATGQTQQDFEKGSLVQGADGVVKPL